MAAPFDAITIDGTELRGEAILAHAQDLHERTGVDWTRSFLGLLEELVDGDRPISARTSGTTGDPKTIGIPRNDLVASAELTTATFGLKANDRALLCLPCDFIAGKMMVVRAMVLGLNLHLADPRGGLLERLDVNDRFRFAAMVPQQLLKAMQEDPERVERQFHTILLGGGPVSEAMIAQLRGLRTAVYQSYGSTETVTHVAFRRLNGADRSDHYTALGAVSFTTDARDRLVISSPHLSTKEHITNDLVELIDATHFRWLGRFDNVILSGGKKVFPEQLESRSAAVLPYPHYFIATPDPVLGQAVSLVIESDRSEPEVTAEAMSALRSVLDKHELPRMLRVVRSFARTSSGKIIRKA